MSSSSTSSPLTLPSLKSLLERTTSFDSDIRFIAISDLVNQLKAQQGTLDVSLQLPIRDVILKLLEDGNSDVTTMSVKCLSVCSQKFSTEILTFIVDKLGVLISTPFRKVSVQENDEGKKANNRDIVTDGLQSLLAAIDREAGKTLCPPLMKSLLIGLNSTPFDLDLVMSCLSVLKGALERKRVSATLAPLVLVVDDALFNSLVDALIAQMKNSKRPESSIQSLSAIARAAGVRVGPYLPLIIPKLQQFCQITKSDEEEADEMKSELWTNCLAAMESLILRCPSQVTPYVPSIVSLAKRLLTYDPLFEYDDNKMDTETDAQDGGASDWGGDDGGDADGWGADGGGEDVAAIVLSATDSTWKIRRAAVGVLSAFIRAKSDLLKDFYGDLCDLFTERFKERDPSVKEEIFLCCRDLLRESVVADKEGATENSAMEDEGPQFVPSFTRTRSSYEILDLKCGGIVDGCVAQFKSADERTQRAIFSVFRELLIIRPCNMAMYFSQMVPLLMEGIEGVGKSSEVLGDALSVIRMVVETHRLNDFKMFLPALSSSTIKSIRLASSVGNSKNVSEALAVLSALAKMSGAEAPPSMALDIFKCAAEQMKLKDVPLELKLSAISTCATVLTHFCSLLPPSCCIEILPVLCERMANESTCQPSLRALAKIAMSPKPNSHDLTFVVNKAEDIVAFLRQTSVALKIDAVRCLIALIKSHGNLFKSPQISSLLNESAQQINESELSLSAALFDCSSNIMGALEKGTLAMGTSMSPILDQIVQNFLPKALRLACSPMLQGVCLTAIIQFFQRLIAVQSKISGLSYTQLLSQILQVVRPDLNKVAFSALSKCIAAITNSAPDAQLKETVNRFIAEVKADGPPHVTQIALLCLGEQGKQRDLSIFPSLFSVCSAAFDSPHDGVRMAASFAIGNIAIGNLTFYLPIILETIRQREDWGYFAFYSIKEILTHFSVSPSSLESFRPHLSALKAPLFSSLESKSEAKREMGSEALGRAVPFDPSDFLSRMGGIIGDFKAAPNTKAATIAAIRYSLTPQMDVKALGAFIPTVIGAMKDESLEVRRQTFLTFNALFRFNSEVIQRDVLVNSVLPALYEETAVHPEHCHEVDYGAFKRIIDDGKPLRKAAFQTLGTLLDVSPHRLSLSEFIRHIQKGLSDSEDIQLTTFQLFTHLGNFHGNAMVEVIDGLPKLLMPQVKVHIANAKTKEPEVAVECLRGILLMLVTFNKIPGVELCSQYQHFFKQVGATQSLAHILKEVQK